MTSATKTSSTVSSRYAVALIDLAEEQGILKQIEKDICDLENMIAASEDLSSMIRSPVLGAAQQGRAITAIAEKAKFQGLTVNFLNVLVQNRRMAALEDIVTAFQQELAQRRGEIRVNVQTAEELAPAQARALAQTISKTVGSEVTLSAVVQPEILGGMIVTVGSHMIDDSVARKLERLKAAMSKQSNQNITETKKVEGM